MRLTRDSVILWMALSAFPPMSLAAVKPFDDIKLMVSQGDYTGAAVELDKIQKLNPDSPLKKQFDVYAVAMLSAECQLHVGSKTKVLKEVQMAIDAADAADDQDGLGRATVLYVLVDHAKNSKYTPRTGDNRTPIDIVDYQSRTSAYPFVLADELDALKQTRWKSNTGFSLTPAIATVRHFAAIRALEHALTGKTDQADEVAAAESKELHALLMDWIKDRQQEVSQIDQDARQIIRKYRGMEAKPVGLGTDRQKLQGYLSDCDKLNDALENIDKGLGGALQPNDIYRAADTLKQDAQRLIDKYPN